jgi:GNAT superfamily N-acetyltransferase
MEIRLFGHQDVGDAVELSDAAGWNQIEADWHRLVRYQPDGCLGAWVNGQLAGTTTFVIYEDRLAWIGMVLVRPEVRGQGIGTCLVRAAMETLRDGPVDIVGLDATEAGRPLYEREGFAEVAPIIRWIGSIRAVGDPGMVTVISPDLVDAVAAYDRATVGVNRTGLLRRLMAIDDGSGFAVVDDDVVEGYVLVRPGRTAWQVGPLVADREALQQHLLGAAAAFLNGENAIVDSLNRYGFHTLLRPAGLEPARHLTRMTAPRPTDDCLTGPEVVAAAGFEWG